MKLQGATGVLFLILLHNVCTVVHIFHQLLLVTEIAVLGDKVGLPDFVLAMELPARDKYDRQQIRCMQ